MVGVSDDIEFPFVADLLCEHLNRKTQSASDAMKLIRCSSDDARMLLSKGSLDAVFLPDMKISGHSIIVRRFELPVFLALQYGTASSYMRKKNIDSIAELVRAIDLLPFDLVLPSSGLRLREETDLFLTRQFIKKRLCFESSSLSAVIRAIAEGIGFGFVPGLYAEDASRLKRVELFGPKAGLWKSTVVVAARDAENTRRLFRTISSRLNAPSV
ncbi:MAG: hypothetical protein RLZZ488_2647 [Pseudomonadota bacterium]